MRGSVVRTGLVVIAAAALAGCSPGSTGSSTISGGGGSVAGSADLSSIKACSLLTPAEIQQAVGAPMKAGQPITDNPEQAICDWESQDGSISVGLIVQPYDDTLWRAFSTTMNATPVSGLGDTAFKNYPHSGDLSIKRGDREIDISIVDFTVSQAKIDAAALTFGNLVLGRV